MIVGQGILREMKRRGFRMWFTWGDGDTPGDTSPLPVDSMLFPVALTPREDGVEVWAPPAWLAAYHAVSGCIPFGVSDPLTALRALLGAGYTREAIMLLHHGGGLRAALLALGFVVVVFDPYQHPRLPP